MQMSRRQFLKLAVGSIGLLAVYPIFIERYLVLINNYRIAVPNLPKAFSGFQIVHLADLHYGPLVPLGLIRNVVERSNQMHPDLIVCTGDYVHEKNSVKQIDEVWPVLAQLIAPSGVFSVLGNHATGQTPRDRITGCSRLDRICGIRLFELSARDIICGWPAQAIYGKITEI